MKPQHVQLELMRHGMTTAQARTLAFREGGLTPRPFGWRIMGEIVHLTQDGAEWEVHPDGLAVWVGGKAPAAVEPATQPELPVTTPDSQTHAMSEAIGRVWEAMEMCEQHGLNPEEVVATAVANYYDAKEIG